MAITHEYQSPALACIIVLFCRKLTHGHQDRRNPDCDEGVGDKDQYAADVRARIQNCLER